jgi:hypothetical protein
MLYFKRSKETSLRIGLHLQYNIGIPSLAYFELKKKLNFFYS